MCNTVIKPCAHPTILRDTAHLLLAVYIPVSYSQHNLLKKHKILIESDIYHRDLKKIIFFDVIEK